MRRDTAAMSWYDLACSFADMKWPHVAATTRRTHAEALMTVLLLSSAKGRPDGKLLRHALGRWAFNTPRRKSKDVPEQVRAALDWVKRNSRDVASLSRPEVLRPVLDGLTVRLDGAPAAPGVISHRRKIFNTAIEYAVEKRLLPANPLPQLKWKPPKTVTTIDRRSVANPVQVRTLLDGVREQGRIGPRMVAFYTRLYYAALRPEEAVRLAKPNLHLPEKGWGEFTLDGADPHAGREWTDSGKNRDSRQLKQRARGETRTVPCTPELTAIINSHVELFGYGRQSVEVLLRIYAKCLDGGDAALRRRIERALGHI